MTRTVQGARVLITGAASGMGRLFAERAVAEQAKAVVLWDRDAAALSRVSAELGAISRGATAIHSLVIDIADLGAIAQAAQRVRTEVGNPDVIINNAGVVTGAYFWEHDSGEDTRRTMQVNALAPMYIAREFLPGMMSTGAISGRRRPARILNMASASGLMSTPRMSVYAASKWAVIGWSDTLRLELAQQGFEHVKVTTVVPSYIRTGMFEGARGPLLTPLMTPQFVVDRAWRGMLRGAPYVMLPWTVGLAKLLKGVLPTRAWDFVADNVFGVYSSMERFTGRKGPGRS